MWTGYGLSRELAGTKGLGTREQREKRLRRLATDNRTNYTEGKQDE
jgi:hypothetical protein